MKTRIYLFLIFSGLGGISAIAQKVSSDQVETKNGPLIIQPIHHATMVLSWNGKTIYIDPTGGSKAFTDIKAPDMILITDIHGDHMNMETLKAVETVNAVIIAPLAVADQLPDAFKQHLVILNNGESTKQLGIELTAIPMYNLPESPDSRHTKGRGNGYIMNIGGKTVYISGDTEDIPEMKALKNVDIAFVCMNMPYTMDINQAANAVLAFKPRIVYPYHYRGSDVEAFKKLVNAGDSKIEVRLKDWYPGNQ